MSDSYTPLTSVAADISSSVNHSGAHGERAVPSGSSALSGSRGETEARRHLRDILHTATAMLNTEGAEGRERIPPPLTRGRSTASVDLLNLESAPTVVAPDSLPLVAGGAEVIHYPDVTEDVAIPLAPPQGMGSLPAGKKVLNALIGVDRLTSIDLVEPLP